MSPNAPLLSTKLRRPAPPQKILPRPVIARRLDEGLSQARAVTLVSAPAGFGKTTALTSWLASVDLPVAWLSLNADDNDPVRFFTYLIAALRSTESAAGVDAFANLRQVEGVLRSGQLPPLERITGALLADVASIEPSRVLLVLDDFHLIQDRFILKVFEKLIAGLSQTNLHLILLTREDPALPLSRLRAGNLLTEIRADDLRFQRDETARFLNDVHSLCLPDAEVAALEQKTEGWVVGLQLAGLSLRNHPDPARFIAGLSGSHRFILSYLTEEVLSRQPEDVQEFLLDTAILERLTGDLCCALTGRTDSHLLLEQLWNANLFLIPLDEAQRWYRYHHLFADLLRSRQKMLHPDKTAELHRRAGQWYAKSAAGLPPMEQAVSISEAVRHLLAAEDFAAAVQLIETYAMDIFNQWYTRVVAGWIRALPPAWVEQSPRINLIFARTHLVQSEYAQAMPYITRLQGMFSRENSRAIPPAITADWLAMQSTILSGQGQPEQALDLALKALAIAPKEDNNAQSQAYLAVAVASQQLDDLPSAEGAYRRLIHLGQESGSLVMELLGRSALALLLIQRGRLNEGHLLAAEGMEQVDRTGILPPICAGLLGELGQVNYQWLNLEQADWYLRQASQVSALGGFSDSEIFYAVFRSRACLLRGDIAGAAAEARRAAGLMREDAPIVVREEVQAQQMIMALASGDVATAEQIFAQVVGPLDALDPGDRGTYQQGVLYNCGLRILMHRERLQARTGAIDLHRFALADRLLDAYRQRAYVPHALEALLLRAQMHAASGDPQAALADLTAALDLAEPEMVLAPFVAEGKIVAAMLAELLSRLSPGSSRAAFVQRVLSAVNTTPEEETAKPPPHAPAEAFPLFEPLTARELDVLRRLAEGQTYEEIAAGLVVSINTVRSHVKAIYGKLGVNNRTAAIEIARRVNLL